MSSVDDNKIVITKITAVNVVDDDFVYYFHFHMHFPVRVRIRIILWHAYWILLQICIISSVPTRIKQISQRLRETIFAQCLLYGRHGTSVTDENTEQNRMWYTIHQSIIILFTKQCACVCLFVRTLLFCSKIVNESTILWEGRIRFYIRLFYRCSSTLPRYKNSMILLCANFTYMPIRIKHRIDNLATIERERLNFGVYV